MEIVWEDIIVELQAFARYLTHKGVWFRGSNPVSFLSGKEIDDYVYETIGRYLENPEKFDPTKGDLVSYLKWNILRSLVSNDVRSGENHLTDVIYGGNGNDEPDSEQSSYKERLLPAVLPLFSDEIDYEAVKEYIENQIRGDAVVEDIFLGLYHYGMKREKIIEEFKMSVNDYNNGVRRLDTVISRAASQFNPNKQTHEQEKSQSKSDFVNLFLQAADNESSDKGMAREFLASEGVNVDRMVSDGLKRIKQMQMIAEAKKTEQEMFASEKIKAQATQWVDELLSKVDFSLPELVRKEELTVSFRNVEHLSQEDIRVILIRHFTLKFLNQQKDNQQ